MAVTVFLNSVSFIPYKNGIFLSAAAAVLPVSLRHATKDTLKLQLFHYRKKKKVNKQNTPHSLDKLSVADK